MASQGEDLNPHQEKELSGKSISELSLLDGILENVETHRETINFRELVEEMNKLKMGPLEQCLLCYDSE